MRRRVGDSRVLALVKAFLKAGILTEDAGLQDSTAGTPQGGILSPLLANIALSVLDDHFEAVWNTHTNDTARVRYRRRGGATYRLVRYADDFVVMVFWHPGARGGDTRRGGWCARLDGAAVGPGENAGRGHRRGV